MARVGQKVAIKVKVQRLVKEQQTRMDALEPPVFPSYQDYLRAISTIRKNILAIPRTPMYNFLLS